MNLIQKFNSSFKQYGEQPAFVLNEQELSYNAFSSLINGSRMLLESLPQFKVQSPVGVLYNESAESYAAVFAIWFSGCIFIPLNPSLPPSYNEQLIRKYGIQAVFQPDKKSSGLISEGLKILNNNGITSSTELPLYSWRREQLLYIITTSGSTGTPRSVPINLENIEAFTEGFLEMYPELNAEDNFLQTYELTADAAFTGYLIPFLLGATVYTLPGGAFKPFSVARVLADNQITWVQVTPSLLACLRPFFNSLNFPSIKHFHFGGEALPAGLAEEWRSHVPNAEISNVYGPTETTVTATIYKCIPGEELKERKNIVSIGKPLKKVEIHIREESEWGSGELYIAGKQVMAGYLFNASQPFWEKFQGGKHYYPTGDYVESDKDGLLYYCGRKDDQVKVSGFRIDLLEVESLIRAFLKDMSNVAVAVVEKSEGIKTLVAFVENYKGNGSEMIKQLYQVLPFYMVPERIVGVENFPLSASGKTDKKILLHNYLKTQNRDA